MGELKHPASNGGTCLLLRAQAICANIDHLTPQAHDWALLDKETLEVRLSLCDHLLYKKHNSAIHKMHSQQAPQFLSRCRDRYEKGCAGEIQRFLQRTAPRDHMWGVLPRDHLRRYRSIMTLPKPAEEAWLGWMGPHFQKAFSHLELGKEWAYFVQSDRVIQCRRAVNLLEVAVRPLVDITAFLGSLPPEIGRLITFQSEDLDWPYTTPTDKLSQL
eukprot:1394781-Rhodomonas_salina.1